MNRGHATLFLPLLVLGSFQIQAAEWPRFRGPNGSGVSSDDKSLPTTWSPTENLKWKLALPGPGVSSPIVVGGRVFVTCYSGYGLDRQDPGNINDLKRHLLCIDAHSGNTIWQKTIDAVQPEDEYSGIGIPSHGYASHTPVSDGERVYVFFGKTGVLAFDWQGNQLWQTSVGTESDPRRWGSASSPVLHKNLVIVTAAAESQALVALHRDTGEEVWRKEAEGFDNVWGTPALVEVDGHTELILGVPYEIWGFDADDGTLRWYCESMDSDQFNSSVLLHDGTIYAIEGRSGGSIAVRPGGQGDVTTTHVVWNGNDASRFGTPVAHEGRLYFISNGVANCIDARTDNRLYRERLQVARPSSAEGRRLNDEPDESENGRPRPETRERGFGRFGGFGGRGGGRGGGDYSSPIIADGKLYYVKGNGETFVLKVGDSFQQLAVNTVTEDSEMFGATPAVSNGKLFLRSNKHLYCISEE